MQKTNEKKALVLTGLSVKSHPLLPVITNKKAEQLIITTSFGTIISQPYGCTIRDIILAVYSEDIEEIYIIGEKDSKEHAINGEEILSKIRKAGIAKETIETIEYIDAAGSNLSSWLSGKQDVNKMITENIDLIKSHPLIPKTLSIYGFIANAETGEFEAVAGS
ncbi:hypothetical protein [Domibacillus enclensis]|uniref:Carbonic anhydrase n=1 Tax=Domibacillus enclensis TaxID=1017273 RepID=A0A1N6NTH2_9BACI|nr:hypothetical protein [Domibacillus enclensis]OXS80139.1 hypothetical protein B1B05_01270 [Domibacillus enclensis]SIP95350.1 carbonic anhydrase [Domibacillus enclensis]